MKTSVTSAKIWRNRSLEQKSDLLAVEEPLQIRIDHGPDTNRESMDLAVTMRTPNNDFELALGFLFSEGLISKSSDVLSVGYCVQVEKEAERGNVIRVKLHPDVQLNTHQLRRNFFTTSSCGVCGKQSIDQVKLACNRVPDGHKFSISAVLNAPKKLRDKQRVFEYTGGLHACGIFDMEGDLLLLREDVGRHNALDKLIGAALEMNLVPLAEHFVVLSGRTSFELVQKAVMAGVPLMAAVGAPSSLAVQLAESTGMTLMGFVRENNFNLYTCKNRLVE